MQGSPEVQGEGQLVGRGHVPVARARLLDALDGTPPGGAALVVAPAGSGKSVLLDQWLAETPIGTRVDLDARHDDAIVLARDLVSALAAAHVGVDTSIASLAPAGGRALGEPFVQALCAELGTLDQPVRLAFDDVHRVANDGVVADLGLLAASLPPNARLVLASRRDLPFSLGRGRLDQVVELRAADLAFSDDEARPLVEGVAGTELDDHDLVVLLDRTDGWAAGLQLAALSLQGSDDPSDAIRRFSGDHRLVVDYLSGEVLEQLDDDVRAFLLRTSVLDELTPDVCAALLPGVDARAVLEELERRAMFLVRLDLTPRFRYHHLFAELMRYRLRAEHPGLERHLRCEAAEVLLARGDVHGAVEQLLAADEHARAFEVLRDHGHQVFERGESATLVSWLEAIASTMPEPPAALYVNLLAAQSGADDYVRSEQTLRALADHGGATPAERTTADALASFRLLADLSLPEGRAFAGRALAGAQALDGDEGTRFLGIGGRDTVELVSTFMLHLAELLEGDVVAARTGFEQAQEHPASRYPIWRINVLGALALAQGWCGRPHDARRSASAAIETARQVGAMDHLATTSAYAALATSCLSELDLAGAALHLESAHACTTRSRRTTMLDLLALLDAQLVARTAGADPALQLLAERPTLTRGRPLLEGDRAALEARLLLATGVPARAAAVLERTSAAVPAARIDVHLALGDVAAARDALDRWQPDPGDDRSCVQHLIRSATVLQHEGDTRRATEVLTGAVDVATTLGLRRPFLEAPEALDLLERSVPARCRPFVEQLVAARSPASARTTVNEALVEPLTARELSVLEYLPSRLRNDEIAEALYISANTLKTHLRNIYRKLGALDRETAVRAATRLGLL